jgi:hypothetical protein
MSLSNDLKLAQLWPITAKGRINRIQPAGDPKIESIYHKSLEPGRHMEHSIADANHWLIQKKKDLTEKIGHSLALNTAVVHGETISDHGRAALFVLDAIDAMQQVSKYQQEIGGLVGALTTNIGKLQTMEQNMLRMVQSNLNAIANLLNNICSWGLPDLPALPNLMPDGMFNWNGFNFSPLAAFAALKPKIGFDKNFAFKQCVIHKPNLDPLRNQPSVIPMYNGLTFGTPNIMSPLGGSLPPTGQDLTNPTFVTQMQTTTTIPVYGPAESSLPPDQVFNPNTSMLGSVPDPNTIISDYQMPAQTYRDNIVSIVPATRGDVVEPTDPDYSTPDLVVRQPKLRQDLVHFVTLREVVASNYEPNLTAEWLFYLDSSRTGRGGAWIQNFQAIYDAFITPSLAYLAANAVPWNHVIRGNGLQNAPKAIPFIAAVRGAADQLNLLWKLSYIEAGILGYPRTKDWDAGADPGYVGSFTGTDLDYRATTVDSSVTNTVILGASTATFPSTSTFPATIAAVLQEVITKATQDIANTPSFRSPHPQFRFIYDAFAQGTEVDRFSQFWREFNANLQLLLIQDPYLVSFVVSYKESLDSAINPLGDTTIYNIVKTDAVTRTRTWTPGTPLLNIPVAPIVNFSSDALPTDANDGWQGLDLDPVAFLARPDIQAQPIPVQMAMLRTNLSFAAVSKFRDAMLSEFQNQIATARAGLVSSNVGFRVEIAADSPQVIDPGALGTQVSFDKIDFDITNNVFSPQEFHIQAPGFYSISGNLEWTGTDVGTRIVTVFQNGIPIYTANTDIGPGPVSLPFATVGEFLQGDVVTVFASHSMAFSYSSSQDVVTGSTFQMIQFSEGTTTTVNPTDGTKIFTADSNFPALTVVRVDGAGNIIPVDPTVIVPDYYGNTIFPFADGIVLEDAVMGNPVTTATTYGGLFQVVGQAPLNVGALIFVGPGGLITQDYQNLITVVQWIICVGRAITPDSFLWEPHIPQRFNMAF